MPVVKINAIEVPPNAGPELEKRFAHRAHAVDNQPGFLGFPAAPPGQGRGPLLRGDAVGVRRGVPGLGERPGRRGARGQQANPVATGASLLEFEVVLDVAGERSTGVAARAASRERPGSRSPPRSSLALACGCGHAGPPSPMRRAHGVPHRHQHPAGPACQADHRHAQLRLADRHRRRRTLAAPDKVDDVTAAMDRSGGTGRSP